jgi:hypothetical protein
LSIHVITTDGAAAPGRLPPATTDAITAVLVGTEAAADRYGWDQPPLLFGLFDHVTADGGAVEIDPSITEPDLWTTPDPRRPGVALPVPAILHRFATDLTSPAARRWLDGWLHTEGRTCVGMGLLFETWVGPRRPGYRYGDLAKAPAALRSEARIVAAVDTNLALHRVIRVRGADTPHVDRWAHLPAEIRHRRVTAALHRLVHIARGH